MKPEKSARNGLDEQRSSVSLVPRRRAYNPSATLRPS